MEPKESDEMERAVAFAQAALEVSFPHTEYVAFSGLGSVCLDGHFTPEALRFIAAQQELISKGKSRRKDT
jgi:hypothetical protein